MATFIIRALYGDVFSYSSTPYFPDVPDTHWAFMYIQKMYEEGIAAGYGDGTYRPSNVVNRAQMAIFITRGFLIFISNPVIDVTPTSYDYGDVMVGSASAGQSFSINNYGTSDLNVNDISLSGGDSAEFILDLNGGTNPCASATPVIGPGAYCTVSVIFVPSSEGLKSADLSVSSDDPVNPVLNIPLNGNGTQQLPYILSVLKNGTGSGTVTSTPSGIDCGADCSESYSGGTVVTLTASPDGSSIFAGWSGACSGTGTCQVTMNSNTTVIASFIPDSGGGGGGTLTVSKSGTGSGTVTSTPSGIDCGADCSESYSGGTVVTLTASPDGGSIFGGWSGACSGTDTCQVTMNSNTTVIASFIPDSGGGGSINYTPIQLTLSGATYSGSIRGVPIGPNPAQEFYSVTRPAACTSMMQIAISGHNIANENMVISNSDFGTAEEALTLYQDFLNTTGYEVNTVVPIGGTTYWYWFSTSFDSEYVTILNPSDSTYYIEVVNESNFDGSFRIEAHCL
jgi:hypothetical protein